MGGDVPPGKRVKRSQIGLRIDVILDETIRNSWDILEVGQPVGVG
jgi:hypothetical protein